MSPSVDFLELKFFEGKNILPTMVGRIVKGTTPFNRDNKENVTKKKNWKKKLTKKKKNDNGNNGTNPLFIGPPQ